MNDEEKLLYLNGMLRFKRTTLNEAVNGQEPTNSIEKTTAFFSSLPSRLYKYRPLDDYTIDSIENQYLYLSQAIKLDDPFECSIDTDITDYFTKNFASISERCFEIAVKETLALASEKEKEITLKIIENCKNSDCTLNMNKAYTLFCGENTKEEGVEVATYLHFINNVINDLRGEKNQSFLKRVINSSKELNKTTRICSLSEIKDSQVMWAMYSDNYKGCCIEYDFEHSIEAAIDTYPVIYSDERNNNVVDILISILVRNMLDRLGKKEAGPNQIQLLRLLLTKSLEWSFQKEWRVMMQDGEEKVVAPPIKAVYLGHKVEQPEFYKIIELSKEQGFNVYKTKINLKTLKIEFEPIESV